MQKSRQGDRRSQSVRPRAEDSESHPRRTDGHPTEAQATQKVTVVRLTRKYADMIDGVDLSDAKVGDELNLTPHDADVLMAEGWAELTRHPRRRAEDLREQASETRTPRGKRMS
jgi:hypothetical protein